MKGTVKNMELLKELTQINSPSGCEKNICGYIKEIAQQYADEVSVDALGSLIVHKKGSGRKIMAAAHMDEIGVIVTFIDDNGYLRFAAVGGLTAAELNHRRVIFDGGVCGVIGLEEEETKPAIGKMYIDIGARTREEAEKKVSIGDCAVFEGPFRESENTVVSKALDNRAGCYVLLEALKNIKNPVNDLYFVFTSQEEVGLRGAKTSAFGVMPELAVAVDVTDTGDTPNCKPNNVRLGAGAAVKVMDRSVMCHSEVRCALIECAKRAQIPYQLEIMTDGGTDAGAIHLTGTGVKTGGISIPVRYIHSPSELADKRDIAACVSLLEEFMNIR